MRPDAFTQLGISQISIHAPLAGCDAREAADAAHAAISIHAPLAGCDPVREITNWQAIVFQSTHPLRGATLFWSMADFIESISIHAPLAGCDVTERTSSIACTGFQSTHPLRGATASVRYFVTLPGLFQSTHPLRGATAHDAAPRVRLCISIHAPLAGCDEMGDMFTNVGVIFQSTHPLRGATSMPSIRLTPTGFQSTHPLRGATMHTLGRQLLDLDFNPRTPCGVRLHSRMVFLTGDGISIHAPLAGCDTTHPVSFFDKFQFQSTHPLRGATCCAACAGTTSTFQSTHPLRGATGRRRG